MGQLEQPPDAPGASAAVLGPEMTGGLWRWRASRGRAQARFLGRTPRRSLASAVAAVAGPELEPSWLRQVHSARVVEARPGEAGRADALWTRRRDLALVISTADCVPVVMAGDGLVAAAHAGWRGLADELLPALVRRLPASPSSLVAWIGPAIGGCCYEVGDDVAADVASASGNAAVIPRPGGRPHLDLVAASWRQLLAAGVGRVEAATACTRCDARRLASFRRDGEEAGRNLAIAWLQADA